MKWCFKLKNPVELVEPSDNLSQAYIKKSNDSLDMAQLSIKNNKKDWAVTTLYYCQYFVLYSLLQKIGIKSENHTCSILLCENFINIIENKFIKQIKKFKSERIEKQYYVSKTDIDSIDIDDMNRQTKKFQKYFIEKIVTLTSKDLLKIRNKIKIFKSKISSRKNN
jgi:uncharacterized protein (UPF0332 family)